MSGVTHLEKAQELQEKNLLAAWRAMLSHEAGRLVLWSILDKTGIAKVGAGMFVHFGSDQDALLRGRQQVGGEILDEFIHTNDPEAYYVMLKEADDRDYELRKAAELTETEGEQED